MDYDIDLYVKKLEYIIKKKLKMYNLLAKKLEVFKSNLKEEEEISSKVKDTFYFWKKNKLNKFIIIYFLSRMEKILPDISDDLREHLMK